MSFLNAPSELLSALKNNLLDDEDAPPSGFSATVVERAAKMIKGWKARPAPNRCHFLETVIDRIVVQAEHFEIRWRVSVIFQGLLGPDPAGQGVQAEAKFLSIASVTCPFNPMHSGRQQTQFGSKLIQSPLPVMRTECANGRIGNLSQRDRGKASRKLPACRQGQVVAEGMFRKESQIHRLGEPF